MIDYTKYIDADPAIMLGKPKVKGTRITVAHVLQKLADGYTPDDILDMYPSLNIEDIKACIAYAYSVVNSEQVITAA